MGVASLGFADLMDQLGRSVLRKDVEALPPGCEAIASDSVGGPVGEQRRGSNPLGSTSQKPRSEIVFRLGFDRYSAFALFRPVVCPIHS